MWPSLPEDCRIISTLIFFCAIRLNTLNEAPGTSGTSKIEMTATSLSFATPLISIPSTSVTSFTIVPGRSVSDERTSRLTGIFLCKLHAAVVEHLCAQAGKLQHLVEGDLIQLARARHQARVRGVNAVHVRVDLAQVRVQRGRNGHGAGVGAPRPRVVMSS